MNIHRKAGKKKTLFFYAQLFSTQYDLLKFGNLVRKATVINTV